MRVYFDNCIVSGEIRGDLAPASEQNAVAELRRRELAGQISIHTSRESVREQERTRNPNTKRLLIEGTAAYPMVPRDHDLMGAQLCPDRSGSYISNRTITDIVDPGLFTAFRVLGLSQADARHLMYAEANECERFVTTDPNFFDVRSKLESHCKHARIRTPAELVSELP
jgi:hypothetical protein